MRPLWFCLAALAAASAFWWPAFRSLSATGAADWQYFHHMWEVGYVALTRYGEWPLWDPYQCGGITLFGNPQNQLYSPLFFVSLLTQPTLASKLFVVLHAAAGFGGMYLFARREQALSPLASLLASAAWAGSGFFAGHGGSGHSAFMPFYLAPLLLLTFRAALRDLRHAVSLALLMTLVLLEGGVYPFPCLGLLLLFDATAQLAARRERLRVLLVGGVSGLLTVLLGAIRLLPIAEELWRNPRIRESPDGVTPVELLTMLTAPGPPASFGGHAFGWHEYGCFVGWGVVALGALGVVVALRERRPWLPAGLLLFGGLTLGAHGALSPWSLLHRLPIYDSLRVPSRFAVLFSFFLALSAAHALAALGRLLSTLRPLRSRPQLVTALLALAVIGLATDLLVVNVPTLDHWSSPPIHDLVLGRGHYLSGDYPHDRYLASFPHMGIGSRDCYEAMSYEIAKGLWLGDLPQARVRDAEGEVRAWGRTTSRAFAETQLREPGSVVFNQNYAPGWRSSIGEVRADELGRLVVVGVPAGVQRVEIAYRPWTLPWGLGSSLLGVLCALGLTWWLRPEGEGGAGVAGQTVGAEAVDGRGDADAEERSQQQGRPEANPG